MRGPTVLETPCRVYRGTLNADGYGYPVLESGQPHVLLHRWVVAQVLGRPLLRSEVVRHRCDNPPCFRYGHLRLGTQGDNVRDMFEKGRENQTYAKGEKASRAKLSAAEVEQIRHLLQTTRLNAKELGALYGVSGSAVRAIRSGQNWSE